MPSSSSGPVSQIQAGELVTQLQLWGYTASSYPDNLTQPTTAEQFITEIYIGIPAFLLFGHNPTFCPTPLWNEEWHQPQPNLGLYHIENISDAFLNQDSRAPLTLRAPTAALIAEKYLGILQEAAISKDFSRLLSPNQHFR